MSTSARYACLEAISTALKTGGGAWGSRVGLNRADSDWAYPYVIIIYSGGFEPNQVRARSADAEIVWVIKVVSDNLREAAETDEAVAALINDRGTQDVLTGALYGGTTWTILTSTREDYISIEESVSENRALYHEGARYRFAMERV